MKQRMFFVVAVGGCGFPVPIVKGDDESYSEEIALYNTRREAIAMAEEQPLCKARGYEIYEWDNCE